MEQKNLQIGIGSDDLKILKSYESLFNDVIDKKFQCTSYLESATDSAKIFRTMLSSQIELSVWKDNLTNHGGLAVERKDKIKGKPIGKIVVTGGGQFSRSQIIQIVKEKWRILDKQTGSIQLKAEILNILEYVISEPSGIKTVAISEFSSGIWILPLNMCIDIIVNTIMTFPYYQKSNILKEIHLVSDVERTAAAFKISCEKFLGGNIPAAPLLSSLTLNNVNIHIMEGYIEEQQVDVIVNCVPEQHSFPAGHRSNAILDQVGTELEKDFFKKLSESSNIQELVVTTGFHLSCQYVYHLVWPSYYNFLLPEWHKKMLKHAVMKCLEKAYQQNMNSLSFPALGTGTISIPKEETIHIMLQEVLQFSRDYPSKKLHVNFVILPNDKELSKTFKSELAKMKTKYMGEMAPKLNEESDKIFKVPQWSREGQKEAGFKEARPPLIHLKGNNEEQLAAAKKWIAKLLQTQECRFIENNHIFYLGKEEHDQLSYLKNYFEVSISEDISPGKATLEIRGRLNSIIPVMLHIENLLWHVQLDYAKKKFSKLTDRPFSIQSPEGNLVRANISKERIFQEKKKQFEKAGLEVQKVEAIQNLFLWAAIKERKKKIWSKNGNGNKSLMVYQEVPYQFCNLVSRVGFQRIYSMPPDPKYGYGIYFNKSLENLVKNLRQTSDSDSVICVFEAEVAIGSYCEGSHHYISPPLLGSRTMDTFDSVVDNDPQPPILTKDKDPKKAS